MNSTSFSVAFNQIATNFITPSIHFLKNNLTLRTKIVASSCFLLTFCSYRLFNTVTTLRNRLSMNDDRFNFINETSKKLEQDDEFIIILATIEELTTEKLADARIEDITRKN